MEDQVAELFGFQHLNPSHHKILIFFLKDLKEKILNLEKLDLVEVQEVASKLQQVKLKEMDILVLKEETVPVEEVVVDLEESYL